MKKSSLPLILAVLTSSAALAGTFGNFNIKPYGDEKIDLATNVTTLPQGGVATDSRSGLVVDAKQMQYKQGDYLKSQNATFKTKEGGTLLAQTSTYTPGNSTLTAQGGLKYSDNRVTNLTAETIDYNTDSGMVVARGSIRALDPSVRANLLVADTKNNVAVLYGNYYYQSGGTTLSNAKPDAVLYVTFRDGKSSATTRPQAQALAPFKPYLK